MKIRIFALAKELGIEAKQLIKYCAEAGVTVKSSSPLASITDEERELVVRHIEAVRQKEAAEKAAAVAAPMREAPHRFGKAKVRTIRPMMPRGRVHRVRQRAAESESVSPSAQGTEAAGTATTVGVEAPPTTSPSTAAPAIGSTETQPRETEAAAPTTEQATQQGEELIAPESVAAATPETATIEPSTSETETTALPPTPAESRAGGQEAATAEVAEKSEAEASEAATADMAPSGKTAATAGEQVGEEQAGQKAGGEPVEKKPAEEESPEKGSSAAPEPLSRDLQMPPIPSPDRKLREVRPRSKSGPSRQRPRPRPSFPHIATPPPSFEVPKAKTKPKEEPVQKPDLKLTEVMDQQQSPLAAHLKKHAEKKKKKKEKELEFDREAKELRRGAPGLLETRQQRRERRKRARELLEEEIEAESKVQPVAPRRRRPKTAQPAQLKTEAELELPCTVRGFCEAIGRPSNVVMQTLFNLGKMMTINDIIDEETALEVALELGVDLKIKREKDVEEELEELTQQEDPEESLKPRPPIVTILGHVDHGKTSLLDRIRRTNVAASEYGGITQRIAAYQVDYEGHKITFVDTPGHAAFGQMRARGANVTDIVVLIVAANDGVMPQTVECISHAKAAGVPIIVALNKMDLPDINVDRVLADLAAHGVTPQEWGGDVEVIRTSALTGQGIDELLETIVLTAELHELKANPDRPAVGVCLESFRDDRRGPLAWVIVQKGTLRIGDIVLCGSAYGRVRAMYDDRDREVEEAGPSTPVIIAGLNEVPNAGDHFYVLDDIEKAREAAEARQERGRAAELARRSRPRSLEEVLAAARGGKQQELNLILKADSPGSLEALRSEIGKLEHPEVRVNIIHEGVGGVNESDVYLASTSNAVIIAFQVVAEERARQLAEQEGVDVRRYLVIYEVTDEIKRLLEGMLEPEQVEVITGRAIVLQTFNISRVGTVAGCRVLNGTIDRSCRIRVIRDQRVLNDYPIASLKRHRDDVSQVREGMECGIRLDGFDDVKEGDLFEAYRVELRKRSLDE